MEQMYKRYFALTYHQQRLSESQQLVEFESGWKVAEWYEEKTIVKVFKKCEINHDMDGPDFKVFTMRVTLKMMN